MSSGDQQSIHQLPLDELSTSTGSDMTRGLPQRAGRRAKTRPGRRLAFSIITVVASLCAAELSLRLAGFQPWQVDPLPIHIEPGERLYEPDAELGYRLHPGTYRFTLSGGYGFTATHGADGLRRNGQTSLTPVNVVHRPIWIFGCSYAYGWGVDDAQTFCSVLQSELPETEIVNFGVPGYGTLHAWLQLQQSLRTREPPESVVIAYCGFHDERNTFVRVRRKYVVPWSRLGPTQQPRAELVDGSLVIHHELAEYSELPGMRSSATIHLAEQVYNLLEFRWSNSNGVTRALLQEFAALCNARGIRLIVAGLTSDSASAATLAWCRDAGVTAIDLSVDLSQRRNTNWPYDSHPSALAHREYASRLRESLETPVNAGTITDRIPGGRNRGAE